MGFTLLELLTIISILVILASLLLVSLSQAKQKAYTAYCINNHKQMAYSCILYATDFRGYIPAPIDPNHVSSFGSFYNTRPNWMEGWMDIFGNTDADHDIDNTLGTSPLWIYVAKSAKVFKCPADTYRIPDIVLGTIERIRSISMNNALGNGEWLNGNYIFSGQNVWYTYNKLEEMKKPADTFIFTDENPTSINDGVLGLVCTDAGTPAAFLVDWPASYHNGGAVIDFSDGHAIRHRWIGTKIRNSVNLPDLNLHNDSYPSDSQPDVLWIAEHATVKK